MHAHRLHVIQSIEAVIQTLFLYQYLSDTSLVLFLSRSLSHLHCVNLREWHPARSIRFFVVVLLFNFCHAVSRHVLGSPGKTFVLDFVGHALRPLRFHFVALDALILILQLLTVYVAWETGHRDMRESDPLAPAEEEDRSVELAPAAAILSTKHPIVEPIFILRYEYCWRRLWQDHGAGLVRSSDDSIV